MMLRHTLRLDTIMLTDIQTNGLDWIGLETDKGRCSQDIYQELIFHISLNSEHPEFPDIVTTTNGVPYPNLDLT